MLSVSVASPRADYFNQHNFNQITKSLADKGWAVIDNFLPFEWSSELLEEQQLQAKQQVFRPVGIGHENDFQVNYSKRNDKIFWLDNHQSRPAQRQYLELLESFRQAVNLDLYLGLYELEAHAATYPPGSHYQRHLDCFQKSNRRVLTTILYLNPRWRESDGGALRLYLENDKPSCYLDIFPEQGRLVTFISDQFYHEVLPTKRLRLSLTGWFLRRVL